MTHCTHLDRVQDMPAQQGLGRVLPLLVACQQQKKHVFTGCDHMFSLENSHLQFMGIYWHSSEDKKEAGIRGPNRQYTSL